MKPRLLDLFCGAGGAAMGYSRAGFEVVGVDMAPQPHYPFEFHQADALEYLAVHGHEYDAIHASPPCQGYSIMNNLPWLRGREYPLLILPVLEMLEGLGKPYVLENVMGARHGAKGLAKRGLEAHGLKAGWLCGIMFGKPFYRHRLFATNWAWLAPGHPKHMGVIKKGPLFGSRLRQVVYSQAEDARGKESWPGRRGAAGSGLTVTTERRYICKSGPYAGKVETTPATTTSSPRLQLRQNGAQANGVGVGHAKGWRLAAEAMGIDWMTRAELTQAIPPCYTFFVGAALRRHLEAP